MITTIDILDQPFDVDFSYTITQVENHAEMLGMEYDVSGITLMDHNHNPLPLPDWLRELIAEDLRGCDRVYEMVLEAAHG